MNAAAALPADVRELLRARVDSVHALEVLLHLFRRAGASTTVTEMAAALVLEQSQVRVACQQLAAQGLTRGAGDIVRISANPGCSIATLYALVHHYERQAADVVAAIGVKTARHDDG